MILSLIRGSCRAGICDVHASSSLASPPTPSSSSHPLFPPPPVYPNPVDDRVVITLGGAQSGVLRSGGKATLTVASPLGTVIERREIEPMRGVELEVGCLANGVYFASIDAGAGPIATASFVVRR